MRYKKLATLYIHFLFLFFCFQVNAQTSPPSQYKDAASELEIPTEEELFNDNPDPVVLSAQIAVRLKKIQQIIPLDYNNHVQKYISYYTSEKRKVHVAKMLGREKKFFPIFEPILAKYGIPDEMKYLAVVESALNPFAYSHAGASGPWQFMYSTALRYNLSISKRVDERRDPYAACDAAARYLLEMYNLYGDWQLAIASYNCGAGNVNKAIKKAGGSKSFWDIQQYLPAETRAYVPSFIAVVYAMKYASKYGVLPYIVDRENTKRITVLQKLNVTDLETVLEIPRQLIIDENPSLLTTTIPQDFVLNLPESKIKAFQLMQDSLYQKAICEIEEQKLESPIISKPIVAEKTTDKKTTDSRTAFEELEKEALQKKTSTWKDIPTVEKTKTPEKSNTKTSTKTATVPTKATTTTTTKNKSNLKEDDVNYKTIAYKVKSGDNLGQIADWFHVNVKDIRRWNNINGNLIDVNDELLLYIHKNDSKKFVRFNYLSKNIKSQLSSQIVTQEEKDNKQQQKKTEDEKPLLDKINPVKVLSKKDCFQYYTIKEGESLWSVAQKYDDVTVQDIMQWNGYKKTPILHKGDKIKVRKIPCK